MLKLSQAVLSNARTTSILRFEKYFKSTIVESKTFEEEAPAPKLKTKSPNSIVAAAFAALKPASDGPHLEIMTPVTDDKITKAKSVNDLLSISEGTGISRRHALKVVSTLAEWSSSGQAKASDFENDARFVKLCRILSKGARVNRNMAARSEDLSTILGVTADDEAARLISSLNLSQMVKVMTTLTLRKRRSIPLLRTLAYNITASQDQLDLKQSADLLYSMCTLNFIDENLLGKICGEITNDLKNDMERSSVIGSIITSLGLLKYKNCEILDSLSEWVLKNQKICRIQDVFSLFITLATVNYQPSNSEEFFKAILPQMSKSEARKPTVWLNFVWSLIILNQATKEHVSSVLNEDFVRKFEENSSPNISSKIKILNINGAARHLLENYDAAVLPESSKIHETSIVKTKEKSKMVDTVVESLKNLMYKENHLALDRNSGFGFSIDAECLLDQKCKSLPFDTNRSSEAKKVAILAYDYHDMCIGKVEPTGPNILAYRLLESQDYKILAIPYTEFKATDKLVHRVQYLESKLKKIVK